jgi:SagB-type dehydrogenase family enzyme
MKNDAARTMPVHGLIDGVARYHQQTKHHFFRYAPSPARLDWANQPDPFRRYEGAPLVALPRLRADDPPASPPYEVLFEAGALAGSVLDASSLARFLECSLAISAWKQAGDVRWALRTNPSSGNLHPTEAYLLIDKVPGLSLSPGLYHYAAREHGMELRADLPDESFRLLLQGFPRHAFLLGLSSVHWREAWKYGERAFRYCQHDLGHAIGGARIAAQMLGWRMLLLDGCADDALASLLGLDRAEDFEGAEREHPGCLAVIWPATHPPGPATRGAFALPLFIDCAISSDLPPRTWHGRANRLSPDDPVRWEMLDRVEAASWKSSEERAVVDLSCEPRSATTPADTSARTSGIHPGPGSAAQVIRQRRSALAFDAATSVSAGNFFTMLSRTMPRVERDLGRRPMPWDAVPWPPAIDLALFAHRVDGLAPGLYMLVRDPSRTTSLRQKTYSQFAWTVPPGCPRDLPLFMLEEGDVRGLAAQLSCGQPIAADGAFSLGMIAEFELSLRRYGPSFYRRLFWETGMIGQLLYLDRGDRRPCHGNRLLLRRPGSSGHGLRRHGVPVVVSLCRRRAAGGPAADDFARLCTSGLIHSTTRSSTRGVRVQGP